MVAPFPHGRIRFHGVPEIASIASYSYNRFNQLTAQTVNGQNCAYAYNADGIRTAKAVGSTVTSYYLDGGNVVGEKVGTSTTTTYLRGLNLISKTKNSTTQYYLHNAHGDVVNLTNTSGNSTKAYSYDAFGNEKNQVASDANPFRYCGEYLDNETNEYYLRARYYDPAVGRFSQADTHWNPSNMIYGDNPQQIGEYKDALGLSRYAYAPQVAAITQAGNLYVYCIENPIVYIDSQAESIIIACILIGAATGAIIGGFAGAHVSKYKLGYVDGKWVLVGVAAGGLIGGLAGWGVGEAIAAIGATATIGSSGTLGSIIYETWQQAEESLRELIGSVTTYADRIFDTHLGRRIVDAYNVDEGIIAEAKYGYKSLTPFIQQQIDKDVYLLESGIVTEVQWHFYLSSQTGAGGPSAPLLEELLLHGINVIFH